MPEYGVTGFAVAAIQGGKTVLLDAVGDADPFSGRKANVDTRYYIASITKTMTAAAIVRLSEEGKLDLDAPVRKYLPHFDLADHEYAKKITVRDLLCHRPGISEGDVVLLDAYTGGVTEDRYYRILKGTEAGKKVDYSNVHFTLLGRVIEAVSGQKWQDYLAERLFLPMGMTRTTARISAVHDDPNFAVPLLPGATGPEPAPSMKTDRTMHAAGGILSTPRDMARWMAMHLSGGQLDGRRILSEASVRAGFETHSTTPVNGAIRKMSGYGHAWEVGEYRDSGRFAAHGGGYVGYMAYVGMLPEKGTGVAVFVNTDLTGSGFGTLVAVELLDRMLGYSFDEVLSKNYSNTTAQLKKIIAGRKPIAPNPAVAGLLSREPRAYVGRYWNALYGNLDIRLSGGLLDAQWDDLPMSLKSTELDAFSAHPNGLDPMEGRFVVGGRRVTSVEMRRGTKVIRFVRR